MDGAMKPAENPETKHLTVSLADELYRIKQHCKDPNHTWKSNSEKSNLKATLQDALKRILSNLNKLMQTFKEEWDNNV